MNNVAKMLIVLMVVGVFSGALLAGVNQASSPLIERHQKRELRRAIFEVLPEARKYESLKKEEFPIYQGLDAKGRKVGLAFIVSGAGYQGQIKMMVGINQELTKLTGMKVLESVETPGLGGKIAEREFQNQFKDLVFKPELEYVKNKKPEKPNQIEAVTGATISTRAVVNTINKQMPQVLKNKR